LCDIFCAFALHDGEFGFTLCRLGGSLATAKPQKRLKQRFTSTEAKKNVRGS